MLKLGMPAPRLTHDQRENLVLADLEGSFPNFAGHAQSWIKVLDGQDPPDFISAGPRGAIGLELVEWLDGGQMGSAKARETQRDRIQQILSLDWKNEYQPKHFRGAFPSPRADQRIALADEPLLRREFFACAADVDSNWSGNPEVWGDSYYQTEFPGYPVLERYVSAIRYIGGEPHGLCWIGEQGDGGAFDPNVPVESLKQALHSKASDYSTPEKQAHLKAHGLTELNLLVHGGFNLFAYNTPRGHLTLEEIARHGAGFYAAHAQQHIFNRVWLFHSLDSADELNQMLGFAPGAGSVRWLAQLWPEFRIFPGSVEG